MLLSILFLLLYLYIEIFIDCFINFVLTSGVLLLDLGSLARSEAAVLAAVLEKGALPQPHRHA